MSTQPTDFCLRCMLRHWGAEFFVSLVAMVLFIASTLPGAGFRGGSEREDRAKHVQVPHVPWVQENILGPDGWKFELNVDLWHIIPIHMSVQTHRLCYMYVCCCPQIFRFPYLFWQLKQIYAPARVVCHLALGLQLTNHSFGLWISSPRRWTKYHRLKAAKQLTASFFGNAS